MADLGNFVVDLIAALGGTPTPGAEKLFSAWQRWEGGHTANSATWNPLNLTAPGSGLPTINRQGVVAIPSEQQGVQRTAALLKTGYPALAAAFRTGQVDFSNPAVQGDLNRWLTGSRTPGITPYVSKIASSYGQAVAPPITTPTTPTAPTVPGVPGRTISGTTIPGVPRLPELNLLALSNKILGSFATTGNINIAKIPAWTAASWTKPPPLPAVTIPGVELAGMPGTKGTVPTTKAPSGALGSTGKLGKVFTAPGADRPGVHTKQAVRDFVAKVAGVYGGPLTITTGTAHHQWVIGENHVQSQHWTGDAADILFGHGTGSDNIDPALTRLGQDALIAAGMPVAQARKVTHWEGGDYNGYNILFNTYVGGNHYNHLHVGV